MDSLLGTDLLYVDTGKPVKSILIARIRQWTLDLVTPNDSAAVKLSVYLATTQLYMTGYIHYRKCGPSYSKML